MVIINKICNKFTSCFILIIVFLFLTKSTVVAAGLPNFPPPDASLDTFFAILETDGSLTHFFTKGERIWKYTCISSTCSADYTRTLSETWASINPKTNWTVAPPVSDLDTFFAILNPDESSNYFFTKGSQLWKYTCIGTTCSADYTRTLSETWASINPKTNWTTPPPTQDLDTFFAILNTDGSINHFFTQGDKMWKYTCKDSVCSADYVKVLSDVWVYITGTNWTTPPPTQDLDTFFAILNTDGSLSHFFTKGSQLWKYTCRGSVCTRDYTRTLTEGFNTITDVYSNWAVSFASRGQIAFSAVSSRLQGSLDGQWFIQPDNKTVAFQPISVPGFWKRDFYNFRPFLRLTKSTAFSGLYPYQSWQGKIWYGIKFQVPANIQGKNLRLRLRGVAAQTDVYLNNVAVGSHLGIFDSFEYNIDTLVNWTGDNLLSLAVTESAPFEDDATQAPTLMIPYSIYDRKLGGIWNNVDLIATNRVFLNNVDITTPDLNSVKLNVKIANSGTTQTVNLAVDIKEKTTGTILKSVTYPSAVTLSSNQTQTIPWTIGQLSPKTWSPKNPFLYTVTVKILQNSLTLDDLAKNFGFKTITLGQVANAAGTLQPKFFLNGNPYFIKSISSVSHVPVTHDAAFINNYLTLIRNTGANAVRFIVNPPTQAWLDKMDELGLLAIIDFGINDDPVDTVTPAYSSSTFLDEAKKEYTARITDYISHPSTAIYFLGNENIYFYPNDTQRIIFFNSLLDYLKTNIDPNHLYLTDAGCESVPGPQLCGNSDMTDTHWYYMWYTYKDDQQFSQDFDTLMGTASSKPHFFSEFGGAYTDEQGNFNADYGNFYSPTFNSYPVDSQYSLHWIGSNPVRPTDALEHQREVADKITNVLLTKRLSSRLAGMNYHAFDNVVYNPYNLSWSSLKTWYFNAYPGGLASPAPVINTTTWKDHTTLETKPAYTALKNLYLNTSAVLYPTGDFNKNGTVETADVKEIVKDYNTATPETDLNTDGTVNAHDFVSETSKIGVIEPW